MQNCWLKTIVLIGALAVGCVPYASRVTITNPDEADFITFPGLADELQSHPVVNLVVVHGIGSQDRTYADGFLEAIRRHAKLRRYSDCSLVDRLITPYGSYSTVHRCALRTEVEHELRVYIVTWSNLTSSFEDSLLAYDWQYFSDTRALVNRNLKRDLIDTSFSDAVLYAGTYGPVLRTAVERALCVILADKTNPDVECNAAEVAANIDAEADTLPTFLVTHSLGSALVIDAISNMSQPTDPATRRTHDELSAAILARTLAKRVRAVFMLANQLPLLYLSRIPPSPPSQKDVHPSIQPPAVAGSLDQLPEPSDAPEKLSKNVAEFTVPFIVGPRPIPIVSFNDDNDLLTFPLPPGWRQRVSVSGEHAVQVVNVRVTNAPFRWLGVAVNPSRAHVGYWKNATVIRLIVEGNPGQ